jgi:hypothetical protein
MSLKETGLHPRRLLYDDYAQDDDIDCDYVDF